MINVGIKFSFEGFHNFPVASSIFGKEVEFLESRHRHNFTVIAKKQVEHSNRDKEFILLQREVRDYIERNYGRPAELGAKSCEMICQDIAEAYDFDYVYCSEDEENFSEFIKK